VADVKKLKEGKTESMEEIERKLKAVETDVGESTNNAV